VETPLIVAALQRLPEEQRRAIVLHHLCDRSVDQVAAETGAPPGTVKARLSRGRESLRQILDEADTTPALPAGRDPIVSLEGRHA
jgi:RNA polymerase sigma-70 factor (ECF subfamily)